MMPITHTTTTKDLVVVTKDLVVTGFVAMVVIAIKKVALAYLASTQQLTFLIASQPLLLLHQTNKKSIMLWSMCLFQHSFHLL